MLTAVDAVDCSTIPRNQVQIAVTVDIAQCDGVSSVPIARDIAAAYPVKGIGRTVIEIETRITSYNVCYTKLLRAALSDFAVPPF